MPKHGSSSCSHSYTATPLSQLRFETYLSHARPLHRNPDSLLLA